MTVRASAWWNPVESTNPPHAMPKKPNRAPRIPIVLTGAVRDKYQQLASARGCSLSRAVSDWLADSIEGVEVVTGLVLAGRQSPHKLAADAMAIASSLRVAAEGVIEATAGGDVTKTPRPGNTGGVSSTRGVGGRQ